MTARRIRAQHAIDAVEAAYRLDGSDERWLSGILQAAAPDLDLGAGLYSFSAETAGRQFVPSSLFVTHQLEPRFQALLAELNRDPPKELLDVLSRGLVRLGGLEQLLGKRHPITRHYRATVGPSGYADGFTMFARDGEGKGVCLSAPSQRVAHHSEAHLAVWHRAGHHFAAAFRLRRKLSAGLPTLEAVLTPGGALVDARGPLKRQADARERLRLAVGRIEKARTHGYRREPEQALRLWRGLVDGRWSLVDRWEADGRRYIAVHLNQPHVEDPRALTARERLVARHVALGASNKEIAFALDWPVGTVATFVKRAVRKLGGRNRLDLIGFDAAAATSLSWQGELIGILRSASEGVGPELESLSSQEGAILHAMLAGASNAEIARARGTSVKTVANQLHAIFLKLDVASRAEAVAKVLGKRTR